MLPETIMLHSVRNMVISDNNLIQEGLRVLRRRLPAGWSLSEATMDARGPIDAVAKIAGPDRRDLVAHAADLLPRAHEEAP